MILKWMNLLMFVVCMTVAVLHFQHGNVWTGVGMVSLSAVNLLMVVR